MRMRCTDCRNPRCNRHSTMPAPSPRYRPVPRPPRSSSRGGKYRRCNRLILGSWRQPPPWHLRCRPKTRICEHTFGAGAAAKQKLLNSCPSLFAQMRPSVLKPEPTACDWDGSASEFTQLSPCQSCATVGNAAFTLRTPSGGSGITVRAAGTSSVHLTPSALNSWFTLPCRACPVMRCRTT